MEKEGKWIRKWAVVVGGIPVVIGTKKECLKEAAGILSSIKEDQVEDSSELQVRQMWVKEED